MGASEHQPDHPPFISNKNISNNKQIPIGRFAPSPTGLLHFGSLIAATASYLNAKHQKGQWLLRIEDIDTQREQKGASQSIIQTLENYGFEWEGQIRYQSQHLQDYQDALNTLSHVTYPCSCTRKKLRATAATGKYSYLYPGFCRNGITDSKALQHSIRLRCDLKNCVSNTHFIELCQPKPYQQDLAKEVGDFILKRSDGMFAYQLAVVVDDEIQGITEIVRGADLFDITPRQRYLQCLLGYKQAQYLHFPVAVDPLGKKLSKQNFSPEITIDEKRTTLVNTLQFLGQNPLEPSEFSTMDDLWLWAVQNWDLTKIPKVLSKEVLSKETLSTEKNE